MYSQILIYQIHVNSLILPHKLLGGRRGSNNDDDDDCTQRTYLNSRDIVAPIEPCPPPYSRSGSHFTFLQAPYSFFPMHCKGISWTFSLSPRSSFWLDKIRGQEKISSTDKFIILSSILKWDTLLILLVYIRWRPLTPASVLTPHLFASCYIDFNGKRETGLNKAGEAWEEIQNMRWWRWWLLLWGRKTKLSIQ